MYEKSGKSGIPTEPHSFDDFSKYCENRFPERLDDLSYFRDHNPDSVRLYFQYQFSQETKQKGRELVRFAIQQDYIHLMGQMQRKMQLYVDQLGISIECNPSSNRLIGTFGKYEFHPVFLFNQAGLHSEDKDDIVQMHVSLNTDDQGVFDTSISFEYAIVAATLMQKTDKEGKRLYTEREIEDYLRNLQRMGHEQSFSDCVIRMEQSREDYPHELQ